MIHLTRSLVRRWLESLLHTHDSPRRTAAAFAVGVFVSFSPALGLHTLLALIVAGRTHLPLHGHPHRHPPEAP
ncbi:MAG: DUF2062 domain-containing protein [Vicinamibacterales bacterium]|jgi:uncharacterized protein (DUF2062 family)|nr:DUF2062 domain-containing protein [Vicinamibacterales bacterium]